MSLRVEQPAPHVRRVVIDRPPVNALDTAEMAALERTLEDIEHDLDVRCVVLAGAHGAFTAGGDLREQQGLSGAGRAEYLDRFLALVDRVEALRVPVIAAIDGPCMGGGLELALACDIRLAATGAAFCASAVNVGLVASVQRLPRVVGLGSAMEMLLTGATYNACCAKRWQLVTAVYEPEELHTAVLALASRIASRAPLAVETAKVLAQQAFDLTPAQAREEQLVHFERLGATGDHAEALDAFAAKRTAEFQRR